MARADKKSGTPSPEWWKHLRKEKRTFWKKVRKAYKNMKEAIRGDQG